MSFVCFLRTPLELIARDWRDGDGRATKRTSVRVEFAHHAALSCNPCTALIGTAITGEGPPFQISPKVWFNVCTNSPRWSTPVLCCAGCSWLGMRRATVATCCGCEPNLWTLLEPYITAYASLEVGILFYMNTSNSIYTFGKGWISKLYFNKATPTEFIDEYSKLLCAHLH